MAAVVACAGACGQDEISIRQRGDEARADYGLSRLSSAANAVSAAARSPAAYAEFVAEVERLRPGFSDAVAETAELHLVFLALGPLEALIERPLEEQVEALALTVWPTALEARPRQGERARDYLERICGAELALECKHVVAEYRPLMLSALVWRRLKERAREAYARCRRCVEDAGYRAAVDAFVEREKELSSRAGDAEEAAHPKSWPVAGERARAWTGAPLLSRNLEGEMHLDGVEIAPGGSRAALAARLRDQKVLGVYLHPKDTVRTLRAMLGDAAAAGYREAAILARARDYPYARKEYRLALGRRARGQRVRVRDIDTIQVLVQALDIAAASAEGPPRL